MEDVSKNLDTLMPLAPTSHKLDELDAFARTDDVLASLQKQYLDAKALRLKSQKEYGADDGMTGMAIDLEDSEWCAMQTRYMELRDNRITLARAQSVMEEEARVQKIAAEKREQEKALNYFYAMERIKDIKENAKTDYALLIWALLMLDSIKTEFFRIQNSYKFNACAA